MKNRITTLEQSKRLKELGVSQEIKVFDFVFLERKGLDTRIFFRIVTGKTTYKDQSIIYSVKEYSDVDTPYCIKHDSEGKYQDIIKAFDGGQIDELLPKFIEVLDQEYELYFFPYTSNPEYGYKREINGKWKRAIYCQAKTHVESKANLVIKLLENKLITL